MEHFKPYEVVDQNTYQQMGDSAESLLTLDCRFSFDGIWEFFYQRDGHCVIICNNWHTGGPFQWRGWRTVEAAHKLGSPTGHEQHTAGNAGDLTIQGYTAEQARQIIKENQDNPLLAKITRLEANVSWLHFDCKQLIGQERIHVFVA